MNNKNLRRFSSNKLSGLLTPFLLGLLIILLFTASFISAYTENGSIFTTANNQDLLQNNNKFIFITNFKVQDYDGAILSIQLHNKILYMAAGGDGVEVAKIFRFTPNSYAATTITNRTYPQVTMQFYDSGLVENIAVDGNVIYAAAGNTGVQTIQVVEKPYLTVKNVTLSSVDLELFNGTLLSNVSVLNGTLMGFVDNSTITYDFNNGSYFNGTISAGDSLNATIYNAAVSNGTHTFTELSGVVVKGSITDGDVFVGENLPHHGVLLDSYIYNQDSYTKDLYKFGNYLFVADDKNGLLVLDVTDPANIQFVSSLSNYASNVRAFTIEVDETNNIAYVGDYENGLVAIDISDVNNPQLISTLSEVHGIKNLRVYNDLVFLAGGNFGVYIVDAATPTSMTVTSNFLIGNDFASSIVYDSTNDYLYVANGPGGLRIIDVSDLSQPELVSDSYESGIANDLIYTTEWLILANDFAGAFFMTKNYVPSTPSITVTYIGSGNETKTQVSWTASYDPDDGGAEVPTYELQISNDNSFENPNVTEEYDSFKKSIVIEDEFSNIDNGTFFVRVRGIDKDNVESDWSDIANFTVGLTNATEENNTDTGGGGIPWEINWTTSITSLSIIAIVYVIKKRKR